MQNFYYIDMEGEKSQIFSDMMKFNKELLNSNVSSFVVELDDFVVKVDLIGQSVFVNDEEINIECNDILSNVRFINFERFGMDKDSNGNTVHRSLGRGIGFQGSLNGKNVKKYIFINGNNVELMVN